MKKRPRYIPEADAQETLDNFFYYLDVMAKPSRRSEVLEE